MMKPKMPNIKRAPPVKNELIPIRHAIDIHTRSILPKDDNLNFIDPLAVNLPIKALQREKVILDAMSRLIKRNLPPLGYILIAGIIAMLAIVIIYDAVIKDYIEASQDYQIKRELNNLPPDAEPPRLFDFSGLIPGVKR